MSSFFGSLNFPRVVILTSLLASAIVGYLDYTRSNELARLEEEVREAPKLVRLIQMNAMELDSLQKIANREGIVGEGVDDVEFYIRKKASAENVNIGQVETSTSTKTPVRGVEDRVYKIKPKEKTSRSPPGMNCS